MIIDSIKKKRGYIKYVIEHLENNPSIWDDLKFHSVNSFISRPKNFETYLKKKRPGEYFEYDSQELETLTKSIWKALTRKTTEPHPQTLQNLSHVLSIPLDYGDFEFKLEKKKDPNLLKYLIEEEENFSYKEEEVENLLENDELWAAHYHQIDESINTYQDLALRFKPLDEKDIDILNESILNINQKLWTKIPWDLIKTRLSLKKIIIRGLILKNKVRCFYILYPLTGETKDLIECYKITRSGEFKPEHILSTYVGAKAIYISWVYGDNRYDRGFILRFLKAEIPFIKWTSDVIRIYTRPDSKLGDDVVKRNNFELLTSEDISPIQYLKGFS